MIEFVRDALQREMKRARIGGKPLSKRAGLNDKAVHDIMHRVEDPGVFTMMKLADALGVPLDRLLPPRKLRALEYQRARVLRELAAVADALGVTVEDLLR